MTTNEAQAAVKTGATVQHISGIFGKAVYLSGEWMGIEGPRGRVDEATIRTVEFDPT